MVKNLPANAGDAGDVGSIPGSGRSPGGGNGTPLQYSCLENPTEREPWWAIVRGVAESDTTEHANALIGHRRDFLGKPVVKTLPSNAGMQVRSLVGELISYQPCSQKNKTEAIL